MIVKLASGSVPSVFYFELLFQARLSNVPEIVFLVDMFVFLGFLMIMRHPLINEGVTHTVQQCIGHDSRLAHGFVRDVRKTHERRDMAGYTVFAKRLDNFEGKLL